VEVADAVLTFEAAFLLDLLVARLGVAADLGVRLLRPGRLPGGVHFRLLGRLRDWLRRGARIWGWRGGGLDDTPPSDNVALSLGQVHLLGRGRGPLSFRSGRLACAGALRFFPLNTAR
jgi:hypothetical protein